MYKKYSVYITLEIFGMWERKYRKTKKRKMFCYRTISHICKSELEFRRWVEKKIDIAKKEVLTDWQNSYEIRAPHWAVGIDRFYFDEYCFRSSTAPDIIVEANTIRMVCDYSKETYETCLKDLTVEQFYEQFGHLCKKGE